MEKLVVEGGVRLRGTVEISGAKNSCLPIMAATILADERCVIKNVPSLADITTMVRLLKTLGMRVEYEGDTVVIEPTKERKFIAPYKLVSTMRASVCVLGPLIGKIRQAEVSFPGGCVIGRLPIDLQLIGLTALCA